MTAATARGWTSLIAALSGLLLVTPVAADPQSQPTPEAPSESVQLPDVVISATRLPAGAIVVPPAVTVLNRDAIQRTPFRDGTQVDDVLRYVPDVQPSNLSSRYNHPTAQALSLRGLGSRRALVLMDGVPLNDGFGGWINWGLIPDAVQRLEVVPGGGSNLYGTWAMGGVVHVLTERPGVGHAVRGDSRVGNLSTYSNSATARYGTDRLGLQLSGRWFHTNGFITVPEYQRGPVDRTNDSRHENLHAVLTTALASRTSLRLSGGYFHEDRTFGTFLSLSTRTIGHTALGLQHETTRGDRLEGQLFAQWQTFRNLTSQTTPLFSPLRLGEFRDRIQAIPSNDFGGSSQFALTVDRRNRLVIGADARAIVGESEEQVFNQTGPIGRTIAGGKQVGGGAFAEWIATPTGRLTIIPSFRMDWWKNFEGRIESVSGTISQPRDNVETALNPKLAVQYAVAQDVRFGASFYQAFRAPTLNELYRGFSFAGFSFLPNENLGPERLIGGDVKLDVDLVSEDRLTLRIVGHHDEVKDQILLVSTSALSQQRQNVGRTRTDGADVTLRARPMRELLVSLGYAYAYSIIASFPQAPNREGKRVPNVSAHQVVMTLTAGRLETVQVTLMGRYLSRQFADDLNAQPIADFVVLDLSIQKQLGKHWRLALDAENLTDRQYIATQTGTIKTLGAPLLVMGGVRAEF
jgi:iron complex outermembrane receptor protein